MIQTNDRRKISALSTWVTSRLHCNPVCLFLFLFLCAVIIIAFFIPFFDFGWLFGTDDYTHLYHTQKMASSSSLGNFYTLMGDEVSNSESDISPFNYPFGLWMFASFIIKLTGLSAMQAVFIFTALFLVSLIGSFYYYSGIYLSSCEQRLVAVLFLISMPNMALSLLSYRPSVFTLPFLFLAILIAYRQPVDWKMLPILFLRFSSSWSAIPGRSSSS